MKEKLQKELQNLGVLEIQAIKEQEYVKAAAIRDQEENIRKQIESLKTSDE